MFKKLFLALLICLFTSTSNAAWDKSLEGKKDNFGVKIFKAWIGKYENVQILFYDRDNDGKADKTFHAHYNGRCFGDQVIGKTTIDSIKTFEDFVIYLENEEKELKKKSEIMKKKYEESKKKELIKNAI